MRVPRLKTQTLDDQSYASNPGLIEISHANVRWLQPALYPPLSWKILNREKWQRRKEYLVFIEEQLSNGDSRAAIVMSEKPCIIAAYTDELDCVALLQFAHAATPHFGLKQSMRLLTVNTYSYLSQGLASDLTLGKNHLGNYGNFTPFVADFLSDDLERINERKLEISEWEWNRTQGLGQQALQNRISPRDGRPLFCGQPVEFFQKQKL